jgi:hypothetical protein
MNNMNTLNERITEEVLRWPGMSSQPHIMHAVEFCFDGREIGHLHHGGALHIMFPRVLREELLNEKLASIHRWAPRSGVSFQIASENDLTPALRLLRLSYLRFALKKAENAAELFASDSIKFSIPPRCQALLEAFLPPAHNEKPEVGIKI